MFRALLCPSSGAHDCSAEYHTGRPVSVKTDEVALMKFIYSVVCVKCEMFQFFGFVSSVHSYKGESKSKGKIHLMEVTVSNFTYHFST